MLLNFHDMCFFDPTISLYVMFLFIDVFVLCSFEVYSNSVCVMLVCYFSSFDATCKPQHIYRFIDLLCVNVDKAHSEEVGSSN